MNGSASRLNAAMMAPTTMNTMSSTGIGAFVANMTASVMAAMAPPTTNDSTTSSSGPIDEPSEGISSAPCVANQSTVLSITEISAPVPNTRKGRPAPALAPAPALPDSIFTPNVTPPIAITMPLMGMVTPMVVRSSSFGAIPVRNNMRPRTPIVTMVSGLTSWLPCPSNAVQPKMNSCPTTPKSPPIINAFDICFMPIPVSSME